MPAGGAEDRPRGVDPGTVEHALAHRPAEVDAQAADLAHRGEPGRHRVGQVPGGPRGAQLDRLLASLARSKSREPRKWVWQSHRPGSTAGTCGPAGPAASGAPDAGPA